MRSYEFLFWGYATVWLGIVGYLVFLAVRLRRTLRRLERLEKGSPTDQKASL